jgi:hypothetical protein
MLRTKKSGDFDQVTPTRTDKKLIALAWVIACTVFFLMVRH